MGNPIWGLGARYSTHTGGGGGGVSVVEEAEWVIFS